MNEGGGGGAMVHRRLFYIYLLNVPSFPSRYFNKIKLTSRLGRLLALSLEILWKFGLQWSKGLKFTEGKSDSIYREMIVILACVRWLIMIVTVCYSRCYKISKLVACKKGLEKQYRPRSDCL